MDKKAGAYARMPGEGPKLWVVGEVFTFKATGQETDGAYTLWEMTLAPGNGVPAHTHDAEDEMWWVLEGEVEFHLGDRVVKAPAGTFLHGPRANRHAFFNRGNATARVQILAIPAGIEGFFEEIGEPVTEPQGDAPEVDVENMFAVGRRYGIHFEPVP
ncbi:MAG: cupin domain-containing protein [Planctomycetota bacterium]|jgi:quercetin dioxygenase-like cupin family protein